MPTADQTSPRRELLATLMEKVRDDPYPSATMLDLIESLLTDRERPEYAKELLGRIRADRYPSLSLIKRVRRMC